MVRAKSACWIPLRWCAWWNRIESWTCTSIDPKARRVGSACVSSWEADTASPDVDFAPSSGTVTWEDGELGLKSIPVEIFDDMEVEGEETIPVRLLNPPTGGATLSGATTSIAVADNDSGIGLVNNGLSVQESGTLGPSHRFSEAATPAAPRV